MDFIAKRLKQNRELVTSSLFSCFLWLFSGYLFRFFGQIIKPEIVVKFNEVINGFFNEQASIIFLLFSAAVFLLMYFISNVFIKDDDFHDLLIVKAWELAFNAVFSFVSCKFTFEGNVNYAILFFGAMILFPVFIILINPNKNKS